MSEGEGKKERRKKGKDGSSGEGLPRIPGIDVEKLLEKYMPVIDKYIDDKVTQKFQELMEQERARIIEGVKGALNEMLKSNPGSNPGQTPLSPELLALIANILGGGGRSELDKLADTITKARAIADALNPPNPLDKLFFSFIRSQMLANLRLLRKQGLITEEEFREVASE